MSIICRKYNLLFFMTPRTGCTALGEVLLNELEGEYLPQEDLMDAEDYFIVSKKHSTLSQLFKYNFITEKEALSLIKFTTVRNPFDNLVSLYVKKKEKYQPLIKDSNSWVHGQRGYVEDMVYCRTHTFNEWIFRNFKRSVVKRILGFRPSIYSSFTRGMNYTLHFENLQQDFSEVLKLAGISKTLTIPVLNRTLEREKNYREYYSVFSRKMIEFAFKNDLDRYNYYF